MDGAKIEQLLELIAYCVSAGGSYREKAARIRAVAAETCDETNLEEFVSWFEGDSE